MDEETNNSELLINPEPQATEQPKPTNTTTQPATEPPAPKQEATETPKQEEKKMSEIDLSKLSLEELQAAIEKKKAEEAKPKFELDENDPSNLAKWIKQDEFLVISQSVSSTAIERHAVTYPGKLTKFVYMYDANGNRTTDKSKADHARLVSVHEDFVVNEFICSPWLERILTKV